MTKRQIVLQVNFTALIEDDDIHIPPSEVFSANTVTLTMPVLDPKFVIFPKLLEGVTDSVVTELRAKYSQYLHKKEMERKKEEEEKKFMWNQPPLEEDDAAGEIPTTESEQV